MAAVPSLPRIPTFDAARDGNPFEWIVRTAPLVRRARLEALGAIRVEARRQQGEPLRAAGPRVERTSAVSADGKPIGLTKHGMGD